MAGFTVGSQIVLVNISVTTVAILKLQPCKLLKLFAVAGFDLMTIDTIYLFVLSNQNIVSFIVVEF